MESITIKCPITIKAKVTDNLKKQLTKIQSNVKNKY